MKKMTCTLNNQKLSIDVFEAGFFERISGLMFKKNFQYGLLINGTSSIHTCFMKEIMDAVFLNKDNEVIKVISDMKPWRFTKPVLKARKVLELPGGKANLFNIKTGNTLEFSYV